MTRYCPTHLARRIAKRTGSAETASSVAGWILVKVEIDGNLTAKLARQIKAGRGLAHVAGPYRDMPRGDAPELEQKGWLRELKTRLTTMPAKSVEMTGATAMDLLARMLLQGYEMGAATRASAWAVRDVVILGVADVAAAA